MAQVVEINLMAALAAAMYVQLEGALTVDVIDFSVTVTCDDAAKLFPLDICGYIKTNRCEKETTLEFTIKYGFGDICITTTQDIDINLPEQNDDDYVPPVCFVPRPNEPTVWVDFGKRRVFYKWKDSLGMTLDDFYDKIDENKLTLNTIADDIIGTILAKVKPSA